MSEVNHRAPNLLSRRFARIADGVARVTGHPLAFVLSCGAIVIWIVASVFFHISDAWQVPIDTTAAIVTFLMVFLIQSTQNRDSAAIQAKLDELIRALEPAKNKFIGIEKRTIEEVFELRKETGQEVKILEELVAEVGAERDEIEHARFATHNPRAP